MELIANPISNAATKLLEDIAKTITAAVQNLFNTKAPTSSEDRLEGEVKAIVREHEIVYSSLPQFFLATAQQFNPLIYDGQSGVSYVTPA